MRQLSRARHTRDFEDTVGWLAVRCSKTAVTQVLRIAWRTVGSIVERVVDENDASVDRLDGLKRIGIDEISCKRGHREVLGIRVLTRVAFGFRSPDALIALAMLALGGYRPDLPHQKAA